jgi:glycosyltransferase involved in cell wall biosynthesis
MPKSYGKRLLNQYAAKFMGRASMKAVETLRRRTIRLSNSRNTMPALVKDIDWHGTARRKALNERMLVLLDTLGMPRPVEEGTKPVVENVLHAIEKLRPDTAWVMLAIVSGEIPRSETVLAAVRNAETDGPVAALRRAIWSGPLPRVLDSGPFPPVRVIEDAYLVDVHTTAEANYATGIQRVTRESARRWLERHQVTLIGWNSAFRSLRALTPPEVRRACWGGPPVTRYENGPVLVPIRCTYLLPEVATEPDRTDSLRSLAEHSSNRLAVIGHDMVPITVPETCDPGMPAAFARTIAAVRYASCVATVSEASTNEYRCWARMLPSIGLPGPRIDTCLLPTEVVKTSGSDMAAAAERLLVGGLPMVLVVGSHEPRKNHLAVLHAAELLWRDGLRFSLTFIGGNAWNSDAFRATVESLQASGRPVETISSASDALLWSGYRLARFTVFPSFSEGFGLPVVESIMSGTPVITSNFGAMRDNGLPGGALLVDPRNDHALADTMRELLTDDGLLTRLREEAAGRTSRTWDEYAAESWEILTR